MTQSLRKICDEALGTEGLALGDIPALVNGMNAALDLIEKMKGALVVCRGRTHDTFARNEIEQALAAVKEFEK